MGRLLRLLIMFGPVILRAYRQYQRSQQQHERQYRKRQNPNPKGGYSGGGRRQAPPPPPPKPPDNSMFIKSGHAKYKEYDYKGAIEEFSKALELNPKDKVAHFNIACCYSLEEQASKSFVHLDQAVANGFKDFERIKTHDGLAYLRVQKQFDSFEKNGFRLV